MKKNSILGILLTLILTIPCLQAHSQQTTYQQEQERQQREAEQQREQQERQAQQQQERQAQQQQEQQERQAEQQQEQQERQAQQQQERQAQQQQEQQERQAQQQQERQAQQQQEQRERQAQQQQERQTQQPQQERQAGRNLTEGEQKRTPEPSGPVSPFADSSIPGITGGGLVIAPAVRPDGVLTTPAPAVNFIPSLVFQQSAKTATTNMLMNALAAPAMQTKTLGAQATAASQQNLIFQSLLTSQAQQQQQLNSAFDQILMTIIQNTSDPDLASALAGQIGQTDPIQKALTNQLNALSSISQTSATQKSKLATGTGPLGSTSTPTAETCPNMQLLPDGGANCTPVRSLNQCVRVVSSSQTGNAGTFTLTVVFANTCSQAIRLQTLGALDMLGPGQQFTSVTMGHGTQGYQYNADDGTDCFVNADRPGCSSNLRSDL